MAGLDTSKFAQRFSAESREKVSGIYAQLQAGPLGDYPDALDQIRKNVHSLNGVANMLKFSTIGQLAAEMESILKSMVDKKTETYPWVNQLVEKFAGIITSEIQRIEADPKAEQYRHTFLDTLKQVSGGGIYTPELVQTKESKQEDLRFTKERFLKKFITEAEGYVTELTSILGSLYTPEDLETRQTDLKNVVHAFKGSSRLLGFNDLFTNLERLEDFFNDNIKLGRILPEQFKTDFKEVTNKLTVALNRISGGEMENTSDPGLQESVNRILGVETKAVIPVRVEKPAIVVSTPAPEIKIEKPKPAAEPSAPAPGPKKFDRSIFVAKFVDESLENNDLLADNLLNLEKNLTDMNLVKECMRLAHVLKGSARMIGFKYQGGVLHKIEDLLNVFVTGAVKVTEYHAELLIVTVDHLKENLLNIKREQAELPVNQLILDALDNAVAQKPFTIPQVEKPSETPKVKAAEPENRREEPAPSSRSFNMESETREKDDASNENINVRKFGDTIRVNTAKLDETIKLVGELLINRQRSQIRLTELQHLRKMMKGFVYQMTSLVQNSEDEQTRDILRQSERLLSMLEGQAHRQREDMAFQDLIINDLQTNTIKMRMEPLSVIFNAFPRAIRDISRSLNKQVELVIQGEETELDRKMIEKLTDPLIHLVRNAIDHGIESTEERQRLEKPLRGLLRIRAMTEGSNIVLIVQDDGKGIDVESIKAKALQKKLFESQEEIDALNEIEVMKLIFLPNFSTAKLITDLSGRGVGLDIVKKNIEDLKGFISVDSIPGKGTTFTIKLPLTLTTLRSLVCMAGGQKWAIPISSIKRTLVIRKNEVIEVVDRDAIRLDNQIIPLVRLSRTLGINDINEYPDKLMVLVGYFGKEQIAFVVEDIFEETEIVIKPVPALIRKIRNVSSVTVSLNGEIIPILFMPELINSAKLVQEGLKEPVIISKGKENVHTVLVVDDSLNTREIEKTILEAYGYKVETGRDGLDGFEKAMEGNYDIIVSDLEMPRLNGFGFIEKLRQQEKYKHTPVIIVTSRENENDKRRGIEVGANAYIIKGSFDQTSLIDTIESLLA
ncbi:MAG: Hpt domain-containing protein [Bacteroidetes bacterium]|nr:Hpt domain-containing protein [Bacteroidota bacterium]